VLKWLATAVVAVPTAGFGVSQYFGFENSAPAAPDKPEVVASATHHCSEEGSLKTPSKSMVFDNSHQEPIKAEHLILMNKCEAWIAKNEIYARNGYVFKTDFLNDHFKQKNWYKPGGYNGINPIEEGNVALLVRYIDNQ